MPTHLLSSVNGDQMWRMRTALNTRMRLFDPRRFFDQILRTEPTKYAAHFAAVIESTWIVLVLLSSVPMTLTFCAANFSGVRWSLSV